MPIDNFTLLFLCILFRMPYEATLKALESGMKMPAIYRLREEIRANQKGIFTPIQGKTVDDAVDAFCIVAEKYYNDIYASTPYILNQAKLDIKKSAELIKQYIRKNLAEKQILCD